LIGNETLARGARQLRRSLRALKDDTVVGVAGQQDRDRAKKKLEGPWLVDAGAPSVWQAGQSPGNFVVSS
jgi:hypothetical protein